VFETSCKEVPSIIRSFLADLRETSLPLEL
jgi:hypothetical protein